jgi:hypothetical protein
LAKGRTRRRKVVESAQGQLTAQGIADDVTPPLAGAFAEPVEEAFQVFGPGEW